MRLIVRQSERWRSRPTARDGASAQSGTPTTAIVALVRVILRPHGMAQERGAARLHETARVHRVTQQPTLSNLNTLTTQLPYAIQLLEIILRDVFRCQLAAGKTHLLQRAPYPHLTHAISKLACTCSPTEHPSQRQTLTSFLPVSPSAIITLGSQTHALTPIPSYPSQSSTCNSLQPRSGRRNAKKRCVRPCAQIS